MADEKSKKKNGGRPAPKPSAGGGGGGRWLLILAVLGFLIGWWIIYQPLRPDSTLLPPTAGITNRVPEAITNAVTDIAEQARKVTNYVHLPDIATNIFSVPGPAGPTNSPATNITPRPPARTNVATRPMIATNIPPPSSEVRHPQNNFEVQLALDRLGISSGSLDGSLGSQSRAAIRAFQQREGITVTGDLDAATRARLWLRPPAYTNFTVTQADLARLRPVSDTWLGKSRQDRLDYSTILEMAAERGHAHPGYVRAINQGCDWSNIVAGTSLTIPLATQPPLRSRAAYVKIRLAEKCLQAFDQNDRLLAHFPVSIAKFVEKRPVGELKVEKVAAGPNYRFDPKIFPESPEAQKLTQTLMIPPGPNNPVGVAWIGLDRPGYGIHGTPNPEAVGRTESHGCFRLANWNAELLLKLAWVGMPVYVEP